jgi:hypothetical protein
MYTDPTKYGDRPVELLLKKGVFRAKNTIELFLPKRAWTSLQSDWADLAPRTWEAMRAAFDLDSRETFEKPFEINSRAIHLLPEGEISTQLLISITDPRSNADEVDTIIHFFGDAEDDAGNYANSIGYETSIESFDKKSPNEFQRFLDRVEEIYMEHVSMLTGALKVYISEIPSKMGPL